MRLHSNVVVLVEVLLLLDVDVALDVLVLLAVDVLVDDAVDVLVVEDVAVLAVVLVVLEVELDVAVDVDVVDVEVVDVDVLDVVAVVGASSGRRPAQLTFFTPCPRPCLDAGARVADRVLRSAQNPVVAGMYQ